MSKVLLLHINATGHNSLHTRKITATVKWTVLPHPSYKPNLVPSDFHLFGPLRDGLRQRHIMG